jgi:hypothetical protein
MMAHHRSVNITVRVWRRVAGTPQGLFTFVGAVDAAALCAVMQHVERLTRAAAPGGWCIDVLAAGLDGLPLFDLLATLHELRRSGQRARLALAPALRPGLRVQTAVPAPTPSLPH